MDEMAEIVLAVLGLAAVLCVAEAVARFLDDD